MQDEIFDIDLYNDEFFEWHLKYAREYSMVTMDWLLEFVPFRSVVDFGCGRQTYDGHKGTDFAIPDEQAMARGVNVLAAQGGTVLRVRDGVVDRRIQTEADKKTVEGTECGNGVVIDHSSIPNGAGWETQYCHLRQGSVQVKLLVAV